MIHYNDGFCHSGVKGMKWGVRKSDKTAFSTKRKAKKDAKEYARAKMFYGEGAGNRRKLIKATVTDRSKNLKGYKKEFDKHLANQDMAKHATAAKRERATRTARKTTAKTARGLVHAAMGNIGRASAAAAGIYVVAHATGVDKKIGQYMKTQISNVKIWNNMSKNARK